MNTSTEMLAPRARSTGLVVRELSDETLVYDVSRQQAHALDRVTGLVWASCDGNTPVAQMAERLAVELGGSASVDTVWQAIAQLAEKNLLEEEAEARPNVMTRRDLMKKAGLAAAGVVAITSIKVPATSAAAACPTNAGCGQACSKPFGGSTGNGSCNANEANLCDLTNPSGDPSCPGTCCMDNASVTYNNSSCMATGSTQPCCCHGKTCQPKGSGYVCQP